MRVGKGPALASCVAFLLAGAAAVGQPAWASHPQAQMPAAAPAPASLHFTAAGDFGASAQTSTVLNGIRAAAPDLHLALGDLSYGATATEKGWCDYVTSRVGAGLPFELITGNHESNGLDGNIDAFAACLPNKVPGLVGTYGKQWYVDVPASNPVARFVMISPGLKFPNGTWSYDVGTPRYAWTSAAIDGARTAKIPWVVVGMHIPCLSLTSRTCGSGPDLMNLLVSKRVDLVLMGHNHLYERTKQLARSTTCQRIAPGTTSQTCIADAGSNLVQGRGTVFATVGTGGTGLQSLNTADPERPYFSTWAGVGANATWGFLDVRANASRLAASFTRTAGGTYTDSFAINRATSRVAFVGASHSASGATRYKQVTVPGQARSGDAMLMWLTRGTTAQWGAPTGVTGWTLVDSFTNGAIQSTLWKKIGHGWRRRHQRPRRDQHLHQGRPQPGRVVGG